MTGASDNDTSVAFGAARGVPGGGETPMRKSSSLSSVVCPGVGELRTNTTIFTAKRPGAEETLWLRD